MNYKRSLIAITLGVILFLNIFSPSINSKVNALTISKDTIFKKNEFRGVWIATVDNVNWPSKAGLSSTTQQQELSAMYDEIKNMSMNAVIFQVRAKGDAFYTSNYAPWSKYLTGTLGNNPGYDPLKFALEEAHKRNLEFHAWFNPFRISTESNFDKNLYLSKLPSGSPLKSHGEWIVNYEGYHWINPGIPEARQYVIDTILEVVKNYDIDAVHLDDYFYPYPKNNAQFPDAKEFSTYGSGYKDIGDWRRDNINKFLKELSSKIKQQKPQVKFGVSPFGIWRNKSTEVPNGSETNGLTSYNATYADSLKWINENYIDYIIPQIYWNFGLAVADYEKLINWWTQQLKDKKTQLYIGHAAYKIGDGSYGQPWLNEEEIPNQIRYNRTFDVIKGSAFFSVKDLTLNKLGIKDKLKNDLYKYPSLVPNISNISSQKPISPSLNAVLSTGNGIELNWRDDNANTDYYVIYRSEVGQSLDTENPAHILALLRKDNLSSLKFLDTKIESNKLYNYAVTAVNRADVESNPSNISSNSSVSINSINTDKPSPQRTYTNINISASATGRNLSYRFSISDGSSWSIVQPYSTSANYKWTPSKPGNYTIKVDVKEGGSTKDYDASMILNYYVQGDIKILIDPGHGGKDPGSIGFSKTQEKDLNLSIAKKLYNTLSGYGFEVLMSRSDDLFVELSDIASMANSNNADIFISIHQNSFSDPNANGIETYHYSGNNKGQALADKVQDNLIKNTGARNRGVKTANFVVLRETTMPAILVECGFITNELEEGKLKTDSYQDKIVSSIVSGVKEYFNIGNEDVNKDGKVDILDLTAIAANFNIDSTHPNWNKALDLNNDNVIDIFDLVLVAKKIS